MPGAAMIAANRRPGFLKTWLEPLCASLIVLAVLFNPILSIINGHAFGIKPGLVALIQATIVVAALGTAFFGDIRDKAVWVGLAWVSLLLFLILSIARSRVEYKYFGDILTIPAFICLGTQLRASTILKVLFWLQVIAVVLAVWELANPTSFATVFKVAQYYVSSRGYDESQFWAGNDLYVSSERGGGRLLLPGLDVHRGSSVFLEPVSLGNWVIIVTAMCAAFWDDLSWKKLAFFGVSNFVLLVACDGRLAMAVTLLLVLYLPFARQIPAWVSLFYMPGLLVALAAMLGMGWLDGAADTLSGRFGDGIALLGHLNLPQFLGAAPGLNAFDAGLVYFILTQSIFMVIGLWLLLGLSGLGKDKGAHAMLHGIMLFLTFGLPISYAPFSVKTASLMWATYGVLYARSRRRGAKDSADLAKHWA